MRSVAVVSDIHYACAAEQARRHHEMRALSGPVRRTLLRLYRDYVWLRDPYGQNHLLDQFLDRAGSPDLVVANGDYSCNTAFIGVGDDAACASAQECLGKLRQKFPGRFHASYGDHELGKISFVGNQGGLRLASWRRARADLQLEPFWQVAMGNYVLLGVVSTLLALPTFEPEALPAEMPVWQQLRKDHLQKIAHTFASLQPQQKVILFCHDPTALPYLWEEVAALREHAVQLEQTIIGHLHSPLLLWKSRLLAGMPRIGFLGNSARRFSHALNRAKLWKHFRVCLCPSLAGIELLKDGGFLTLELDPEARRPLQVNRHRIRR